MLYTLHSRVSVVRPTQLEIYVKIPRNENATISKNNLHETPKEGEMTNNY